MKIPPIELLQSFYCFIRSKTMAKAALSLGIGQPALSMRLKTLETYFPSPLFSAIGRHKSLSPLGRRLYESLSTTFCDLDDKLAEAIKSAASPDSLVPLRIGCRPEMVSVLVKSVQLFGEHHYRFDTAADVSGAIREGLIDCGLSTDRPDSTQIISREIFITKTVLTIPKKFKLDPSKASAKELRQIPYIFYTKNEVVFRPWYKHIGLELGDFRITHQCEYWPAVCELVNSALGMAIMPDWALGHLSPSSNLCCILNVIPPLKYYFLYRREIRKLVQFSKTL